MEHAFKLKIYTPERTIFDGEAVSLTAPGEAGSFCVLADHASFLSSLIPGKLVLRDAKGASVALSSTGQGFFETGQNKAVVLLESVAA